MLNVPARRQPDETACLPTCVEAVIAFFGRSITTADVRRWCRTTAAGSDVDQAIQGLEDAGVDAELLQLSSRDDLIEMLDAGRPPIAILAEGPGWSHAVVVCDLDEHSVTFMDPRIGGYTRAPWDEFAAAWTRLSRETLLVGTARASHAGPQH